MVVQYCPLQPPFWKPQGVREPMPERQQFYLFLSTVARLLKAQGLRCSLKPQGHLTDIQIGYSFSLGVISLHIKKGFSLTLSLKRTCRTRGNQFRIIAVLDYNFG